MISSGIAGMFISVKGVLASSVGVGGVPGIFSIIIEKIPGTPPTPTELARTPLTEMNIPAIPELIMAITNGNLQRRFTPKIAGSPFSLSIQNITGGEENENRQHTMVEKGSGISNLSEEL